MRKFSIFLLAAFSTFISYSFAASSITNISYNIDWDDIKIYRTDNSNWWYMDINLQDPNTNDRLHFGTVKFSNELFEYTKQRDWDQKIWIVPWDGSDDIKFTISSGSEKSAINEISNKNNTNVTRTVIPAVPKTWPSWNIVWIALATLAIFGGYIYIRKKADI